MLVNVPPLLQRKTPTQKARPNRAEVTSRTAVARPSSVVDEILTSPDDMRFITYPDGVDAIERSDPDRRFADVAGNVARIFLFEHRQAAHRRKVMVTVIGD